jgi:hypothetical protein
MILLIRGYNESGLMLESDVEIEVKLGLTVEWVCSENRSWCVL